METLEFIIQNYSVCGISVAGIISVIVFALKQIKTIKAEIQGDNYNKELREDYKKLEKKLDEVVRTNRDIVKENKEKDKQIEILTDAIAQREGYSNEQKELL